MTRDQKRDFEQDWPAVSLRRAVLDAVEAHNSGRAIDRDLLKECRLLLGGIINEQDERKAA